MRYLLDTRFQEVAQWITEYLSTLRSLTTIQVVHAALQVNLSAQLQALGGTYLNQDQELTISPVGYQAGSDIAVLRYLVSEGQVDSDEVAAYLNQKYPDQNWSGGSWGDFTVQVAEESVVDGDSSAPFDDGGTSRIDAAEQVQQAGAPSGNVNAGPSILSITPPSVDALSEEYDADAVQQAIEDLGTQLFLNDHQIQRGNVTFPAGALDGQVIAPGTLSPASMQPNAWAEVVSQVPGPEKAIELLHRPSQTVDTFVRDQATGISGPGRVRSVSGYTAPAGWTPYRGIHRYRIVKPGDRFTVMSLLLDPERFDQATQVTGVRTRWGFILHKIPHWLGRPPIGIHTIQAVGSAPVPFGYFYDQGGNLNFWSGPDRLFHDRAKIDYQDNGRTWATPLGSSPILDPSAVFLELGKGISAQLITGRTADEVYENLNTLVTLVGAGIRNSGQGPMASLPQGLEHAPPAPPTVLRWDGQVSGPRYTHLSESVDLLQEDRLVEGIPFTYEDCQKMIPNTTHFSLVVMLDVPQLALPSTINQTWPTPERWHQHGIRIGNGEDRDIAIDALVF